MPGLLPKKFPAPVAGPMMPFFAAGLIIMYGVNAGQNAMMASEEYRDDPRNPNRGTNHSAKGAEEHK